MHLARFPRIFLAHLPTPLERLDRLSAALDGPEIWIKRDDCTGLSTGGNKTRKLEFLMGEALAQGADMVMTQGATQSNHARQTAAFAAATGWPVQEIADRNHFDVILDLAQPDTTLSRLVLDLLRQDRPA